MNRSDIQQATQHLRTMAEAIRNGHAVPDIDPPQWSCQEAQDDYNELTALADRLEAAPARAYYDLDNQAVYTLEQAQHAKAGGNAVVALVEGMAL